MLGPLPREPHVVFDGVSRQVGYAGEHYDLVAYRIAFHFLLAFFVYFPAGTGFDVREYSLLYFRAGNVSRRTGVRTTPSRWG